MKQKQRLPKPGQDLATLFPEIASEWDYDKNHPFLPEQFFPKSAYRAFWKCKYCGNSWPAVIYSRTNGNGCPYCAGKIPIPGKTDLATVCPQIATEWDYEQNGTLRPEQCTVHSQKNVVWKCKKCGNRWKTLIQNRTNGHSCPYCTGRFPILGKTDLVTLYPMVANEWDYELNNPQIPEQVTAKSNKRVWWKCHACGRNWLAAVSDRTKNKGCPYCSGRFPVPGETDLATLYPDISIEWDCDLNNPDKPEQVTVKSNKRVWWKCRVCGHNWPAPIYSRTQGHGCPYCSGRLPILGKTDLATLYPEVATEWNNKLNDPIQPEQLPAHSRKMVSWVCKNCGNNWSSKVYHRTSGSGCPFCAGRLPIIGKNDLKTLFPQIAAELDYELNGKLKSEEVSAYSGRKVVWNCAQCGNRWKTAIILRTRGSKCPKCQNLP